MWNGSEVFYKCRKRKFLRQLIHLADSMAEVSVFRAQKKPKQGEHALTSNQSKSYVTAESQ